MATAHRFTFTQFAKATSRASGRPVTFIAAVAVVIIWAVSGPMFGYSEAWQMVINTGTTIVTFLLVFLIQNTQNRDSQQMQIKMDELIRAVNGAHNRLLDLEDLEDNELDELHDLYQRIGARIGAGGESDTGTPEVTPPPAKHEAQTGSHLPATGPILPGRR